MTVGNQHRVTPLDFEIFRVSGVPIRPRIEDQGFVTRKNHLECAVTEPGYFHIIKPIAAIIARGCRFATRRYSPAEAVSAIPEYRIFRGCAPPPRARIPDRHSRSFPSGHRDRSEPVEEVAGRDPRS